MIINHNITALNTHRQMGAATNAQASSMEKLSSGLRINSAKDDAAGLSISEKMRGQIRGLEQASANAQDGISLLQTAEGALNETHSILQRTRELAVQAANDTSTADDRKEIQKEVNQLLEEIDSIAGKTEFNGQKVLDGSYTGKKFHIGANETQTIDIAISNMKTDQLGASTGGFAASNDVLDSASLDFTGVNPATVTIGEVTVELTEDYSGDLARMAKDLNEVFSKTSGINVSAKNNELVFTSEKSFGAITYGGASEAALGIEGAVNPGTSTGALLSTIKVTNPTETSTGGVMTQTDAETAIKAFDNAIKTVSAERSKLGAVQNRLDHTINNLNTSAENLTSAESRIRDVDYAEAA
ncbi:flagellin [Planococcus sp. 107-1]|uniref:flagellin N-terminal helical domain-containing protein n=1 Tax=Planococcus sp. 107-1 TaxID=2908840 RepID=UPI002883142A|nr:flagellin [Planococcus sp. 107-1]